MEKKNIPNYTRVADLKRLEFIRRCIQEEVGDQGLILDVGCGNGIISMQLGKDGYNVHGLEISEEAIAKAKAVNPFSNVEFKQGDAESLKATGQKYDVIICSEVLEHLNTPETLLNELHDLLENNGILLVTVPNGTGPRELFVTRPYLRIRNKHPKLWRIINKVKSVLGYSGKTIQSEASDLDHIQFFTRKQLRKLSTESKFRIINLRPSNFMDDVFPFSLLTKRFLFLQKLDAKIAEYLPKSLTGGYLMLWKKA